MSELPQVKLIIVYTWLSNKKQYPRQLLNLFFEVFTSLDNFYEFFSAKNSGPFVNLSEAIQRSAVELLFHLPSLDDSLLQNIVFCCHGGQVGISVVQYILQILHYRSSCTI